MIASRALSADEEGGLRRVVAWSGATGLLAQIPNTSVAGGIPTFLDLAVADAAPAVDVVDSPLPGPGVMATVIDEQGTETGEILVWVHAGFLSGLEFAWWTDEPPLRFPPSDRVGIRAIKPDTSV